MNPHLLTFQDFHIRGASAPEWNQRYMQMSPGVMRSTLHEWSAGHVRVYRKWMNQRVVQQGGLPRGQVCFALLAHEPGAAMRVQGREFDAGHLFILRGGQEFEIQRPAGVELLSVTLDAQAFAEFLDASPVSRAARQALVCDVVRPEAAALDALRQWIRGRAIGRSARLSGDPMHVLRDVLTRGVDAPPRRAASIAAASMVKESQIMALDEIREQALRIEELCARLRTSRRTLQNSFRQVTGASPLVYLRNLRLNAVRRRLMSTPAGELSVTHAAVEAGFDHLGHFSESYRALFGELPSRTVRRGFSRYSL